MKKLRRNPSASLRVNFIVRHGNGCLNLDFNKIFKIGRIGFEFFVE